MMTYTTHFVVTSQTMMPDFLCAGKKGRHL